MITITAAEDVEGKRSIHRLAATAAGFRRIARAWGKSRSVDGGLDIAGQAGALPLGDAQISTMQKPPP